MLRQLLPAALLGTQTHLVNPTLLAGVMLCRSTVREGETPHKVQTGVRNPGVLDAAITGDDSS